MTTAAPSYGQKADELTLDSGFAETAQTELIQCIAQLHQ
jgi:hypothetical protein